MPGEQERLDPAAAAAVVARPATIRVRVELVLLRNGLNGCAGWRLPTLLRAALHHPNRKERPG
ncbi:hypothetical protein [Micromonospora sp. B9E7]|uniref:hypothetical protein n=1 Tax=Micromonospora sp. B9E7 TaxID=3153574 RepID=UPI00325EA2E9